VPSLPAPEYVQASKLAQSAASVHPYDLHVFQNLDATLPQRGNGVQCLYSHILAPTPTSSFPTRLQHSAVLVQAALATLNSIQSRHYVKEMSLGEMMMA
jgi:hypothetical protein